MTIITWLPTFIIGSKNKKNKDLVLLIDKIYKLYHDRPQEMKKMTVDVFGGDKLKTLLEIENKIELPKSLWKSCPGMSLKN